MVNENRTQNGTPNAIQNGNQTRRGPCCFDVDGTLADTERDGHRVAFNAAFGEVGLDWNWDVESIWRSAGDYGRKRAHPSLHQKLRSSGIGRVGLDGLDGWIASLHKIKTKHYVSLLEARRNSIAPGVERLIRGLRDAKIKIAIATTTTEENVTALLKSTLGEDSLGWFDVIGAGDIVPGKKARTGYLSLGAEAAGLGGSKCIAVEDSENGLRASLAAGLDTVVTVNDLHPATEFQRSFAGAIGSGRTHSAIRCA